MIFTFIKYLVIGLGYGPVLLLFILLVPTTYRIYWSGRADYGERYTCYAYYYKRKTLLWRLSTLSLNLGYPSSQRKIPAPDLMRWEDNRRDWLESYGFKSECSWVPLRKWRETDGTD